MSSLRRVILVGCSALFATNIGLAKQPRSNSELTYRNPRSMIELVSGSEPVTQALPRPVQSDDRDTVQSDDQDRAKELKDYLSDQPDLILKPAGSDTGDRMSKNKGSAREDSTDDQVSVDQQDDDSDESAANGVDVMLFSSLPSILDVSVNSPPSAGILPENYAAEAFSARPIEFQPFGYQRIGNYRTFAQWTAPWVAYRPLYFEDIWLERHGYDYGPMQPFVSAAKFYGRIPFIPYMKGATPPRECVYSLGLGRPGDCTPHFFSLPKKSECGLLYQIAFTTGTVLLIP